MRIRKHYIPFPQQAVKRRGLSERIVKRELERRGWTVWLGHGMNLLKQETYPNVRRKYALLERLLNKHYPGVLEELQYLCHVHHGLPDFLCYRRGEFKFVEAKLGHEPLQESQRKCFPKLAALGFSIEIHTVAAPCTKTREALVDLATGEKKIIERQARLVLRWP